METSQKSRFNVSLVGAGGTLGKEVKSFLEERRFPAARMNLFDSEKYEGVIMEYKGEASLITKVEEDSFIHSDIVFLCSGRTEGKKYASFPRKKLSLLIDVSLAHGEDEHVPAVHCDINPAEMNAEMGVVSSPQPISVFLANLLHPLDLSFGVERVSANVFQPVSDFGQEGIEELYQQTAKVLSFSKIPKEVFGRQIAFNLIPDTLLSDSLKGPGIDRDIATEVSRILGWSDRRMTMRIILAPVFFCHSFSVHLVMRDRPKASEVNEVLKNAKGMKLSARSRGVTPVEVAGNREIYSSESREDGLPQGGFWLWLVSDHLVSGAALNAVRIAETFIADHQVH